MSISKLLKYSDWLFNCSKCNSLYKTSATGIQTHLTVNNDEATRTFISKELVGVKSNTTASEGMSAENLTQWLCDNQFCFIVSGGGKAPEFCHYFQRFPLKCAVVKAVNLSTVGLEFVKVSHHSTPGDELGEGVLMPPINV